jgi:hypothetical protein
MAKAAKETAKAEDKKEKETVVKVAQNGVTRPKDGTTTGQVWEIADKLSADTQKPAVRKAVVDACHERGINTSTASTQYGKWRKFHGLVGDKSPGTGPAPAKETPEPTAVATSDAPPPPPPEAEVVTD